MISQNIHWMATMMMAGRTRKFTGSEVRQVFFGGWDAMVGLSFAGSSRV
jgi:hypothetical protein